MNKGTITGIKATLVVIAVSTLLLLFVAFTGKYLANLPWSSLFERIHVIGPVLLAVWVSTSVLLMTRAKPWRAYYGAVEAGEEPDDETARQSFSLAYGIPPVSSLNTFTFALVAVSIMAVDLSRHAGDPWLAFHILLPTLIYFPVAGVGTYYILKVLCRPVLLDLAERSPEILLGEYDRRYPFPLGPLVFIRKNVAWRIGIRQKVLVSMVLLGLIGVVFLYMALRGLSAVEAGGALEDYKSYLYWLVVSQLGVSLFISFALSYLAGRDVGDPIAEIIRASDAISKGDLSERARVVTDDELGQVAAAMNNMAVYLVTGLEDRLAKLEHMMKRAEKVGHEVQATTGIVVDVIGEVSSGASAQRESVEEASNMSARLGESAGAISERVSRIEEHAEESLKDCESASLTLQNMIGSMDELKQQMENTGSEMSLALEGARKIMKVVELIDEISDQINLLSINAALEAAGAGEAGKRFNAVAEQIAGLAYRTNQSTEQANLLVQELIEGVERAASASESERASVEEAISSMENTGGSMVALFDRVEKVTGQAKGISQSTGKQSESVNSLSERLQGIEDTAMNMEAAIMEIHSSLNQLSRVAKDLTATLDEENTSDTAKT